MAKARKTTPNYQLTRLAEMLPLDPAAALRFAASLHPAILGPYRDTIQRGYSAARNPAFYRQLGTDPAEAEQEAYAAIRALLAGNP